MPNLLPKIGLGGLHRGSPRLLIARTTAPCQDFLCRFSNRLGMWLHGKLRRSRFELFKHRDPGSKLLRAVLCTEDKLKKLEGLGEEVGSFSRRIKL